MAQGKLKWFDPKKGYGFIKPDDGDKDAFFTRLGTRESKHNTT